MHREDVEMCRQDRIRGAGSGGNGPSVSEMVASGCGDGCGCALVLVEGRAANRIRPFGRRIAEAVRFRHMLDRARRELPGIRAAWSHLTSLSMSLARQGCCRFTRSEACSTGIGHAAAPDYKDTAKLPPPWGRAEAGDRDRTRCIVCVGWRGVTVSKSGHV